MMNHVANSEYVSAESGRVRLLRWLALTGLWVLIVLLSVNGFSCNPSTQIPTSQKGSTTVPLFNTWTIAWNSQAAGRGFQAYWDAPIFYPMKGTFALSEPQPLTTVLAPLRWCGATPALQYNLWLAGSLVLNGIFCWRLLRWFTCSFPAALAGSTAMILLPMVHDQLDVLQLIPLWPSLWTINAMMQFRSAVSEPAASRTSILRQVFSLALAFVCVAACSIHHALFLALLMVGSVIPLCIPFVTLRGVSLLACVAVTSAVLLAPLVIPMRQVLKTVHSAREEPLISRLSSTGSDLFTTPGASRELIWFGNKSSDRSLSPGALRSLLGIAGMVCLILKRTQRDHDSRPFRWFLILLTFWSAIGAMGTNLTIGEWKPWLTAIHFVPGLSQVRSAFRFGYFYQMAIVLLGAFVIDDLWRTRSGRFRGLKTAAILLLAFAFMVEWLPRSPRLIDVPEPGQADWVAMVEATGVAEQGVLVLPYVSGVSERLFEPTTRWMIDSCESSVRLVNGYSGFFPDDFHVWNELLNGLWVPEQLAREMRSRNIAVLAVIHDDQAANRIETEEGRLHFRRVSTDPTRTIQIYLVNERP